MKSPILLIILLFTFSLNSQAAPPIGWGADPLPDNTVATCGNIYLISDKVSEPIGPRHRVSGIDTNGRKFSVQVGQDVFENVELYASQDPYFTLNDFVGGSTLQLFWGGYKKAFISFENEPRIEIDCELVDF